MNCIAVRRTDPLYAPANPRLDVMTMSAILFVRFSSVTLRSSGCSTLPALDASSRTISRTFIVYALVPTARFSDFWNFAVAIICIVLVIFLMLRTALRRFTIARALAMDSNPSLSSGTRQDIGHRRGRQLPGVRLL